MDAALYRKKVLGCWLGKSIGGTLGGPTEGKMGPFNLTFYDPVPTTMIPNDDLDLQVVWACSVNAREDKTVSARNLAQAWLDHVGFAMDEYGVGIRNMRNGIWPPFSGSYDNFFTDGMGCAIRSEIWACLAPGNPELATKFAYQDACVDHAGAGLYAEVFLAAMESAAFVESDMRKIVDIGLSFIPKDCPLYEGIQDAIQWADENLSFDYLFDKIIGKYLKENFTDVKVNLPIIVAALLLGKGDFSATICNAVNFGADTDCTGATTGAIIGILNPDAIGEEWLKPIGRNLVLSDPIVGINAPATIDEFSDMICELSKQIKLDETTLATTFTPKMIHGLAVTRPIGSSVPPSEALEISGHWWTWPVDLRDDHELALQFTVTIDTEDDYTVMVNSAAEHVCFLDGAKFLEWASGGRHRPSFHWMPDYHGTKLHLTPGPHTLDIVFRHVPKGRKLEWTMGVGRTNTQWVPNAFR